MVRIQCLKAFQTIFKNVSFYCEMMNGKIIWMNGRLFSIINEIYLSIINKFGSVLVLLIIVSGVLV